MRLNECFSVNLVVAAISNWNLFYYYKTNWLMPFIYVIYNANKYTLNNPEGNIYFYWVFLPECALCHLFSISVFVSCPSSDMIAECFLALFSVILYYTSINKED